ncbi:MAG: copper chaperone PCu(A)C [Balneolaceae bacterium]|nr:MAG: copper chaperone PCu(A)C [Balneolaceae bacterium]
MNASFIKVLFLAFAIPFFFSCTSEEEIQSGAQLELPEDGIEIVDAWARPGRDGGVSAIYMHVLNGSAETDTLVAFSSPVAGLVELHETFDRGDGMMGMRESEEPYFPARSIVSMRPGGLHVMLMQLNRALREGDEVELSLTFSQAGEFTITAPVRSPE